MEVYKSVYDAMIFKATSKDYGYIDQQVLDILSESKQRVARNTYKNIPEDERSWIAERWAWETLFADEMHAFPGLKTKWKGATKYLDHRSSATISRPQNPLVKTRGSPAWSEEALAQRKTSQKGMTTTESEATASARKRSMSVSDLSSESDYSAVAVVTPMPKRRWLGK